jgi:hypothetical protein
MGPVPRTGTIRRGGQQRAFQQNRFHNAGN